jgi:UDP-hydrolysing UDP-N-acetyl-D-glucosamine 2-epimerase
VSGTRAEFGLLEPLISALFADGRFQAALFVTGAHLSPAHGLTVREIEAKGFPIAARIEMQLASDTGIGAAKSLGIAVLGFAEAFGATNLDGLVVLGDRYEVWAAAVSATLLGVPVIHISGGEVTEGAFDDSIRHSITKCAALHLVSRESYRRRVIQMGEDPARVVLTGPLHLDTIAKLKPWTADELVARTMLPRAARNLLVTYHPETRGLVATETAVAELLAALDLVADVNVLFTLPNADPNSSLIAMAVRQYCAARQGRAAWVASLGQLGYLSAVSLSDVVVGNSSSGLTEAPALGRPTVNIGDRQKGRYMPESVLCVPGGDRHALVAAIRSAMSPEFVRTAEYVRNREMQGAGLVVPAMVNAIVDRQQLWSSRKSFYDLPENLPS